MREVDDESPRMETGKRALAHRPVISLQVPAKCLARPHQTHLLRCEWSHSDMDQRPCSAFGDRHDRNSFPPVLRFSIGETLRNTRQMVPTLLIQSTRIAWREMESYLRRLVGLWLVQPRSNHW